MGRGNDQFSMNLQAQPVGFFFPLLWEYLKQSAKKLLCTAIRSENWSQLNSLNQEIINLRMTMLESYIQKTGRFILPPSPFHKVTISILLCLWDNKEGLCKVRQDEQRDFLMNRRNECFFNLKETVFKTQFLENRMKSNINIVSRCFLRSCRSE